MNHKRSVSWGAVALALLAVLAMPPGNCLPTGSQSGAVVNPHLSTDKSIDCSRTERILGGLIKEGMTDEQTVLAVFHWVRRVLYHGDGPAELAYDFHKMINVLGNGSCLRQTTPLAYLLSRLGYESQSWVHDGHHMIQVRYGGRWHCLDPHMNFLVYDRGEKPEIAGLDQLRADSTLAWDAAREGRAGPGYLLCGDPPSYFTGGGEWANEGGWPEVKLEEPFGGIEIRRGESYVRTWMPGPYCFKRSWPFVSVPYHTCGPGDRKDTVNWPLYEPHRARIGSLETFRHGGAGRLIYAPDLHSDHYLEAVVSGTNIIYDRARGLVASNPNQRAEIVFAVGCPYVITAGSLSLKTGGGNQVGAEVSTDQGRTWQTVGLAAGPGGLAAEIVDQVNGSFEGYCLKLTFEGRTSIDSLRLESHFQLNPYALPYLVPGKNRVRLEGGRFGSPLTVEWCYAEGPDWARTQAVRRTFSGPGEFDIEAGGIKYPRNISITLSVDP